MNLYYSSFSFIYTYIRLIYEEKPIYYIVRIISLDRNNNWDVVFY